MEKLLQNESNSNLEQAFKRNFNNNESVNFLSNVVARTDLSQASRIKEIASMALNEIKSSLTQSNFERRLSYGSKRDLLTLDYLMNEHPKKDELFGSDPSWSINLSDESKQALSRNLTVDENIRRGSPMIQAMETMGYENLDASCLHYNLASVVHDPSTNTHILLNPNPYMFDGETLKHAPALAKKSIESMGDGARAVVADEQLASKRGSEAIVRYLNSIGI